MSEENKETNPKHTEGSSQTHEHKHEEHKHETQDLPLHHVKHPAPQDKESVFLKHVWKFTTAIFAIALIISLLIGNIGGISAAEAGNKAVNAINQELQGQATASLLSVNEQNGLYNARINLQGQILDTYITKDGALLFPQAIAIDNTDEGDGNNVPTNGNSNGNVVRREVDITDDPFLGEEDAKVVVVEFSDFQCPFCKRFRDQTFDQIKSKYIDTFKVKFVYKDFPLSIHPDAENTALAAECADEQGKFWEYHDIIFENQGALDINSLKQHAVTLGLNEEQFNECLDSKKYLDEVNEDLNEGSSNGITGTPGFFINGRLLSGAQPFSEFETIIEQELGNRPIQGPTGSATASPQPSAGNCGPQQGGSTAPIEQTGPINVDTQGAYSLGEEDAPVVVVEFSDFQCPFCKKSFDESIGQLKEEFVDNGKVLFVYKHFPLSFHPEAQPAAEASECAGEQGKFWEFHDGLFENQGQLSSSYYSGLAGDLGLDVNKFNECVESGRYTNKVNADFGDGQNYGVSGTPTFFVNGKKIVGAQPYNTIKAAIEAEL